MSCFVNCPLFSVVFQNFYDIITLWLGRKSTTCKLFFGQFLIVVFSPPINFLDCWGRKSTTSKLFFGQFPIYLFFTSHQFPEPIQHAPERSHVRGQRHHGTHRYLLLWFALFVRYTLRCMYCLRFGFSPHFVRRFFFFFHRILLTELTFRFFFRFRVPLVSKVNQPRSRPIYIPDMQQQQTHRSLPCLGMLCFLFRACDGVSPPTLAVGVRVWW